MESQSDSSAVLETTQTVKSFKLLIFDFDGTLVDTAPDIHQSVNVVLKDLGAQPRSLEEVKGVIGFGIRYLMRELLKSDGSVKVDDALVEKAASSFREHYEAHLVEETQVYPKVLEVLSGPLKPFHKAVVTNKPHHLTEKILKTLSLDSFFDPVIGTGLSFPPKPEADAVEAAMAMHGVKPDETLLIGDSAVDYETARKAGIHFAWVTYGYDTINPSKEMIVFQSPWEWRVLTNGNV